MEIKKGGKHAVLLGATGLVGGHVLELLLNHQAYNKVTVIARSSPDKNYGLKLEWVVNDLTDPDTYQALIKGDDLFITLGTTLAKAGSKEAFIKVDKDLVVHIADLGGSNGIDQLSLVTAVGADPGSLFFYNRVKGELEKEVCKMPYRSIHIFHPSMLLGDRDESRPLETAGQWVSRGLNSIFGSKLGKYQPVQAVSLARAMVHFSQQLDPGIHFHPSDEIATFDGDNRIT